MAGPVQDVAVVAEAGAVAGAVPRLLPAVPRNRAAQMGAHRRDRVQGAALVAGGGGLLAVDLPDGGVAGPQLRRVTCRPAVEVGQVDEDVDLVVGEVHCPRVREFANGGPRGIEAVHLRLVSRSWRCSPIVRLAQRSSGGCVPTVPTADGFA